MFFLLFSLLPELYLSVTNTSQNLKCIEDSKNFHKIICNVSVHIDDKVKFEWFTENLHNSNVNITNFDDIIINGAIKNVTSIATIFIDQKSSIRKGKATIVVNSIINDDNKMMKKFELTTGDNTDLILISVFASIGGILLVSSIFLIIYLRRRKSQHVYNPRQPHTIVDNNADDNEVWFNVDLNSPRSGNNSFFNNGFENDNNNNMRTIENENYNDLPISRYISQMSSTQSRRDSDQDFSDSDISDISCLGKAVIAIGGGADLGAGQISVRDHEEVDVIQQDFGTGYTAIRKRDTGEYGFLPTTSLVFR